MRFRQQQPHDGHQPEGGGAADREQQIAELSSPNWPARISHMTS
jgi:hypothetical protein